MHIYFEWLLGLGPPFANDVLDLLINMKGYIRTGHRTKGGNETKTDHQKTTLTKEKINNCTTKPHRQDKMGKSPKEAYSKM